MYYFRK